ncbi:hypothetical protein DV711_14655 [Motiliproteus coralliicola]|uniref:MSHA biogenesis protein MshI n=1 Tax=Motiliproteus coralliicola TaxID=2283196 RepID=A0A369WHC2_9GAMM|nr:hypothetical protein [Motiliproteus coralliicola]RDE18855.1 hypothetical protein DV711_14655 [Motiliproteus coralliicola]
MALAHYDRRKPKPLRCQQLDDCRLDNPEPLKAAVAQLGLNGASVSWVLSPKDYNLLLVEAPAVDEAEMADALRWRVKDMLSFDIEHAVLDFFELPEDAYRGRSRMLYVAVIQQSVSDRIESLVNGAGMALKALLIPELMLIRLKQLEGETLATAVLGLQSPHSLISMVSEGSLYLTRQVDSDVSLLSPDAVEIETRASGLVLDIQRSLDYYESQIGKPPCLRLLVCPQQPGETPLLGQLRYNLAVELVQLDLGEHIDSETPLTPLLQSQAMMAIAAALPEVES